MLLCILDYYSKFPIVNIAGSLTTEELIEAVNTVCAEFGLPKKIFQIKA